MKYPVSWAKNLKKNEVKSSVEYLEKNVKKYQDLSFEWIKYRSKINSGKYDLESKEAIGKFLESVYNYTEGQKLRRRLEDAVRKRKERETKKNYQYTIVLDSYSNRQLNEIMKGDNLSRSVAIRKCIFSVYGESINTFVSINNKMFEIINDRRKLEEWEVALNNREKEILVRESQQSEISQECEKYFSKIKRGLVSFISGRGEIRKRIDIDENSIRELLRTLSERHNEVLFRVKFDEIGQISDLEIEEV